MSAWDDVVDVAVKPIAAPIAAGTAIAGGAELGSAYLGYKGQDKANETNLQIARETSAFNAVQARKARRFSRLEARKARDFNKKMSNTAWRRGVRDMKLAGINPMLAFSNGGASAPTAPAASATSASGVSTRVENPYRSFEGLGSSALGHLKVINEVKNMQETNKNLQASNDFIRKQADNVEARTDIDRQRVEAEKAKARLWREVVNFLKNAGIGSGNSAKDKDGLFGRMLRYLSPSSPDSMDAFDKMLDLQEKYTPPGKGHYWVIPPK